MRFIGPGTSLQTCNSVAAGAIRAPKRARVVVTSSQLSLDMTWLSLTSRQRSLSCRSSWSYLSEYQSHRIDQITTECMNALGGGLVMRWKLQAARWPILAPSRYEVGPGGLGLQCKVGAQLLGSR
ncbi:hypothetical protein MHU86_12890 [Fragilaria crotonensis]|nr:hypothetical protein MHU86_12890 [Fragilaria crotonensis]